MAKNMVRNTVHKLGMITKLLISKHCFF